MAGIFKISLDKVRIFARHGLFEQEAVVGNEFEVNLVVVYRDDGGETEDLSNSISYVDLYGIVRKEMAKPRKLLETVAKSIVTTVREEFPRTLTVECRISKITPPISNFDGSVSVDYKFEE